jgi:hypothetical protein
MHIPSAQAAGQLCTLCFTHETAAGVEQQLHNCRMDSGWGVGPRPVGIAGAGDEPGHVDEVLDDKSASGKCEIGLRIACDPGHRARDECPQ